ncbi:MAG: response regulator [Candidatus Eisenbacteria bacterium]
MKGIEKERILVIDDEDAIRRIIGLHLTRGGFEPILACNGPEGLALAREQKPALILLDVMMPEMDGYDVARKLRSQFATSQIPIIMLTARDALDDKLAGLEVGANDYVTKPFAAGELLARIGTVLSWSKAQRSANPLTGLPGNISIEEHLERLIAAASPFSVVYVDLDNFKAYNDHYGYNEGDVAIRELARILLLACEAEGEGSEFVGHIGGDDFLFTSDPGRAEAISRRVLDEFGKILVDLVPAQDRERGYLEVEGRTGERKRFPILSVTLAMVTSDGKRISHVAQVADLASEVKRYGKSIEGSVLVRDRRRSGEPADHVVLATGARSEVRGVEKPKP